MNKYGTEYDDLINKYGDISKVSSNEIYALGKTESDWKSGAVSETNVRGVLQVTENTSKDHKIVGDYTTDDNQFKAGVGEYEKDLDYYNGDRKLARMAYNGGRDAVDLWVKNGMPESGQGLGLSRRRAGKEATAKKITEVLEYPGRFQANLDEFEAGKYQSENDEEHTKLMDVALMEIAENEVAGSQPDRSAPYDFFSGVNKTLIGAAGFPVDMVNKVLGLVGLESDEPLLGSEQLSGLAEDTGIINPEDMEESRAERVGRVAGSAVPGIGVTGGLASIGAKAGPALTKTALEKMGPIASQKLGKKLGTIGQKRSGGPSVIDVPILRGFRKAPKTFAGLEAVAAGGAAAGGEIGRQYGGAQEIIGQIIGGIGAPHTLTLAKLPTMLPMVKVITRVAKTFFTKSGAKDTASQVLKKGLGDRADTLRMSGEADLLPGHKLSLGGQTGDTRLLGLEKAVVKQLPELADDMARNQDETNTAIQKALETKGNIENAVVFFEGQTLRAENAIRARIGASVVKMNESASRLKPGSSRAEYSRIMSRELDSALKDVRKQETIVWDNLDETSKLGLSSAQKSFDDYISSETPIPDFVRKFLKGVKEKQLIITPEGFERAAPSTVLKIRSFKDVKEFRTKLLRFQRTARASGNADQAYFLQRINEGVLDDIANSNLGPDFSAAVAFSRSLNEKFTRGPVGQLMKFSSKGGKAIPPELIGETMLSTTAAKAAHSVRAVRKAVGSNEAMEDAIAGTIRSRLFKGTGEFDSLAAKNFIEKNSELLDEFPNLKNQINNAIDDVNVRGKLEERSKKVSSALVDRRKSAGAVILGAHPDKRLNAVLNHPRRKQMMKSLVNSTKRDGAAFSGIQDSFNTELFNRSMSGKTSASSAPILSGRKMRSFFNETKGDLLDSGMFTKEELNRFNTIVNTAERLEKQILARPESAEIISTNAGMLENFVLSMMGARLGAQFGAGMASSLVVAQAGSTLVKTVANKLPLDRIINVLGEAVKDPKIMKELLEKRTSFKQQTEGVKMLNAWIATLGFPVDEDAD